MEKKGWKTLAIVSIVMFILSAAMAVFHRWKYNYKPSWEIVSVANNKAKIKFGRDEFEYTLGTDPMFIGYGRYIVEVNTTTNSNNVANGVVAQMYDLKEKIKVDSLKTMLQAV